MDKNQILNGLTLLAKAYAFAKDGKAEMAGKLFVQAAEDGALDEVMDGVAQGAEALEEDDFEDMDDDEGGDDEGSDDSDDDAAALEGSAKRRRSRKEETVKVTLPESVARLAARTLI